MSNCLKNRIFFIGIPGHNRVILLLLFAITLSGCSRYTADSFGGLQKQRPSQYEDGRKKASKPGRYRQRPGSQSVPSARQKSKFRQKSSSGIPSARQKVKIERKSSERIPSANQNTKFVPRKSYDIPSSRQKVARYKKKSYDVPSSRQNRYGAKRSSLDGFSDQKKFNIGRKKTGGSPSGFHKAGKRNKFSENIPSARQKVKMQKREAYDIPSSRQKVKIKSRRSLSIPSSAGQNKDYGKRSSREKFTGKKSSLNYGREKRVPSTAFAGMKNMKRSMRSGKRTSIASDAATTGRNKASPKYRTTKMKLGGKRNSAERHGYGNDRYKQVTRRGILPGLRKSALRNNYGAGPSASKRRVNSAGVNRGMPRSRNKDAFSGIQRNYSADKRYNKNRKRVTAAFVFSGRKLRDRDSFSGRKKDVSGGFSFSNRKKRVIGRTGVSGLRTGRKSSESFTVKRNRTDQAFRFSKSRNRVVSKKTFLFFSSEKRSRGGDSFGIKKSRNQRMYSFSSKKKKVTRGRFSLLVIRRDRSHDSFTIKRNKTSGHFAFNDKKRRAIKRFSPFRPVRERETSSFGGRKKKQSMRQNVFHKKSRTVKHREGFWWDMQHAIFGKDKRKKKRELDLFDPQMRKKMKFDKFGGF